MRYTQYQLNRMEAVDIYKLVLRGDIKIFPSGFWQRPDALTNAIKVIKFLIEDILKWKEEDIKNKLTKEVFKENKLYGMLAQVFKVSTYLAIDNAYPNKFKPWELQSTPMNYWNKETAKYATKWMIEEKLKWNDEAIKNKLMIEVFYKNNLRGMLSNVFNNSSYDAINNAYPNKFKPWEFSRVPVDYWNLDTAKEATKWLIEEKLKWNDEDVKNKLTLDVFNKYGLRGMVQRVFNNSTFNAVNNAYPNRFKPWDFPKGLRNKTMNLF